jgi:hypothetical protein
MLSTQKKHPHFMELQYEINQYLNEYLPERLKSEGIVLAEILTSIIDLSRNTKDVKRDLALVPNLPYVLFFLANKSFQVGPSLISIGHNNQIGSIRIEGDVAGGDITNITINNYPGRKPYIKISKQRALSKNGYQGSIISVPVQVLVGTVLLVIGVLIGLYLNATSNAAANTTPIIYLNITTVATADQMLTATNEAKASTPIPTPFSTIVMAQLPSNTPTPSVSPMTPVPSTPVPPTPVPPTPVPSTPVPPTPVPPTPVPPTPVPPTPVPPTPVPPTPSRNVYAGSWEGKLSSDDYYEPNISFIISQDGNIIFMDIRGTPNGCPAGFIARVGMDGSSFGQVSGDRFEMAISSNQIVIDIQGSFTSINTVSGSVNVLSERSGCPSFTDTWQGIKREG